MQEHYIKHLKQYKIIVKLKMFDTMFTLNETAQRKTVKRCKHFGKLFFSVNFKVKYCNAQCKNQADVYKSRAKNKY